MAAPTSGTAGPPPTRAMNTQRLPDRSPGNAASRTRRFVLAGLLLGASCAAVVSALAVPDDAPAAGGDDASNAADDDYVARFQRAQRLMGKGSDEAAETLLRTLISERPEEASVHHALGLLLQFRKRPAEATDALLAAARLAPKEAVIQRDTGLHLCSVGRNEEGERFLAVAAALNPEDVETAVGHGAALRALHRTSEAEAVYRRAVKAEANSVDAAVGLAACIVETRPAEALALVAPTTGQWPDLLLVRGQALLRLDRADEAVPALAGAIRTAPPGAAGLAFVAGAARSLVLCGDVESASAAVSKWVAMEREFGGSSEDPYVCLAETREARGDHRGALDALAAGPPIEEATAERRAEAKLLRAALLIRSGSASDAKVVLESLTEFSAERFERAAAMRLLGRTPAAEFAKLASRPGRANDVEWVESLAAEMAGDAGAAAAARNRAAILSRPAGEFPGLLVRPVPANK